jgi:hypothetical protein
MSLGVFALILTIAAGFFLTGSAFFVGHTLMSKTKNEITKKLIYDVIMTIGFMVIGRITIAAIGIKIFQS